MRWTWARLGAVLVATSVVLAACFVPPPDPPPPTPPPQQGGPPSGDCAPGGASTTTLSEDAAGADAAEAVREADADPSLRDDDDRVPLVIVTDADDGRARDYEVVGVADEDEARMVARYAAAVHDVVAVEVDGPVELLATFPPNDPYFGNQWGLQEGTTTFGQAWGTATGGDTVIAVVDTGVQADHPDLAGKVLAGWNFVNDSSNADDDHGHGTHVAGIAGALTGNGVGIAGAAPYADILPVKVLDSGGSGWWSDVAAGIEWAVEQCVEVINLSLGGGGGNALVEDALQTAVDAGVIAVAAGGNGSFSYPAAYDTTIAVASLDSNLRRSSFSTIADYLDVAAPGSNILSTVIYSDYVAWSGTSMAAPFVAAAVAMLFELQPDCTYDQVRDRVRSTTGPLSQGSTEVGEGIIEPDALTATTC